MWKFPPGILGLLTLSLASVAGDVVAPGWCVMSGTSPFGRPFANNTPASNPANIKLLEKVCGREYTEAACCTDDQVSQLQDNFQLAHGFLSMCPACWSNFKKLWCEFSCSPNQSLFVNVSETTNRESKEVLKADYFITPQFGQGLFDSCKSVQSPILNQLALEAMVGASNTKDYLSVLKRLGDNERSPIKISFTTSASGKIEPMNAKPQPCNSTNPDFGCSCIDCPATCVYLPALPGKKPECKVGKLNCVGFGVGICYFGILLGLVAYLVFKRLEAKGYVPVDFEEEDVNVGEGGENQTSPLLPNTSLRPHSAPRFVEQQSKINAFFQRAFYRLGYICAKHSILVILIGLLVVLVCSLGIIHFSVVTDPVQLWVSESSQALQHKRYFEEHFGPFYRTEQLIFTARDGNSIITQDYLTQVFHIQDEISGLLGQGVSNLNTTLTDICFNPIGTGCIVQSFTGFFQDKVDNFRIAQLAECISNPSDDSCLPVFKMPLKPDLLFGGVNDSNYMESRAVVVTYVVKNSLNESYVDRAKSWERELVKYLKTLKECQGSKACGINGTIDLSGISFSFSTEISIETELSSQTSSNILTIILSYLVMFLYASIALGKYTHPTRLFVDSRFLLGLGGIIIVLFSVLVSVGIFSYANLGITLIIAEVIPFLVLAVGVDNIFILVNEFDRSDPEAPVEERVAQSLATVGPSILLSAVTETIAFSMGAFVTMPAVRTFSAYAALAVFVDAALQMTVFVSLLSLDAKRNDENRIDCLPCVTLYDAFPKPAGPIESKLQVFTRKYFIKFILHPPFKALLVLMFSTFFLFCAASIPYLEFGLDQKVALPHTSYLLEYFENLETYLRVGPPVYFIAKDVDVTTRHGQQTLCGRFTTCNNFSLATTLDQERQRSIRSTIAQPSSNWLEDFFNYLNPDSGCCRQKNCSDDPFKDCEPCWKNWKGTMEGFPEGDDFTNFLQVWLDAIPSEDCPHGGKAYSDAISIRNGKVIASNFRTFHTVLKTQHDFISAHEQALRISKEIEAENGVETFAYSIFYVFFEQYEDIVKLTVGILGGGLLSIGLVSAILLTPWNALIIVGLTAVILVDLLGVMYWWGIALNAVSLVNLGIAMGISVEFLSHILRSYAINIGNRRERVSKALWEIGSSVFSGITITKFFGVLVLAFSPSKIFEIYYFRMYLTIVLLGSTHGLILLPILLTWIGERTVLMSDECVRQTAINGSTKQDKERVRRTSKGSVGRGRYVDEGDLGSEVDAEDENWDDDLIERDL